MNAAGRNRKPPRYLLREDVVKRIMRPLARGRFLEVGCGQGQMLATLAGLGFRGDGYDRSPDARTAAAGLLSRRGVEGVRLLDELEERSYYDYILFFEVLGYWADPAGEIGRLAELLRPGGKMIFSFSNRRTAGAAEERTGNMRCYTRSEVLTIVRGTAGLVVERCWNYGFPLTNILKPVLDLYHRFRTGQGPGDRELAVDRSGLSDRFLPVRVAAILFNRVTTWPFALLQSLFRDTDLGTGYVVVAAKTGPAAAGGGSKA
jgi:SAM-dependent methyltransferase